MKRGGNLCRTPLARGTSTLARTPMKRTGWETFRKPAKVSRPRTWNRTHAKAVAELEVSRPVVLARSAGRCEARIPGVCNVNAVHVHHRKLRRSGVHSPANLLHVCLACHDRIHAEVARAKAAGMLVSPWDDPAEIPVGSW